MRIPPLAALLGVVCLACQPQSGPLTDQTRQDVDAQVRAASAALVDAMNVGDAPTVLAFYQDGPSFVYLGCTDYILGGESFRRMVGPYYRADQPRDFALGIVAAQVLGPDQAVVSLQGSSANGSALFLTQVWIREDGAWRVSLEHASWPGCPEPRGPHPFTAAPEGAALQPGTPGN